MDMQYLNENALKDLIRRLSNSNDPDNKEDIDIVKGAMESFHIYVDTVVKNETKFLLQAGNLEGQEYRDAVLQYDNDRHSAHEKAIGDAILVNRLAARKGLPPVFTGDDAQRHQVVDFCLELDQYLFRNRWMKLS